METMRKTVTGKQREIVTGKQRRRQSQGKRKEIVTGNQRGRQLQGKIGGRQSQGNRNEGSHRETERDSYTETEKKTVTRN